MTIDLDEIESRINEGVLRRHVCAQEARAAEAAAVEAAWAAEAAARAAEAEAASWDRITTAVLDAIELECGARREEKG